MDEDIAATNFLEQDKRDSVVKSFFVISRYVLAGRKQDSEGVMLDCVIQSDPKRDRQA